MAVVDWTGSMNEVGKLVHSELWWGVLTEGGCLEW